MVIRVNTGTYKVQIEKKPAPLKQYFFFYKNRRKQLFQIAKGLSNCHWTKYNLVLPSAIAHKGELVFLQQSLAPLPKSKLASIISPIMRQSLSGHSSLSWCFCLTRPFWGKTTTANSLADKGNTTIFARLAPTGKLQCLTTYCRYNGRT